MEMSYDFSVYTLQRSGVVVGYAAFRPNRYTRRRRGLFRRPESTEDVIEGSYYFLGDRLPTGFSRMDGREGDYVIGSVVRYGDNDYELGKVDDDRVIEIWAEHFDDAE